MWGILLALALLGGVAATIVLGGDDGDDGTGTTTVRGVIGSEKAEFFADPAVEKALAAQGFTDRRPAGRVDRRHLRRVFERVNVVQVDSVNVLVRSQELPLFARLGPHPRTMLADAIDDGELFEFWAHMAAIVPSSQHPLFRWRMGVDHQWKAVTKLGALSGPGDMTPAFAFDLDDLGLKIGDIKAVLSIDESTHLLSTALVTLGLDAQGKSMKLELRYRLTSSNEPIKFPSVSG